MSTTGGRSASAAPQSIASVTAIDMTDDELAPSPQAPRFMWSSCPADCRSMLATRFICAGKSWPLDHRGRSAARRNWDPSRPPGHALSRPVSLPPGRPQQAYAKAAALAASDPTVMKRAIDMTDDELAAIAFGPTLLVKSPTVIAKACLRQCSLPLVPTASVAKGECKEDRQKFCKDAIEAKGDVGACLNQQ